MTIRRFELNITTNSSGAATVYSPVVSGYIHSIQYVKTDFADGVDFAVTGNTSGINLWTESDVNAAKTVMPRGPTHTPAGVAALYAAGGTAINDRLAIGQEQIKVVIAQGGNTKTGKVIVTIDDGR